MWTDFIQFGLKLPKKAQLGLRKSFILLFFNHASIKVDPLKMLTSSLEKEFKMFKIFGKIVCTTVIQWLSLKICWWIIWGTT